MPDKPGQKPVAEDVIALIRKLLLFIFQVNMLQPPNYFLNILIYAQRVELLSSWLEQPPIVVNSSNYRNM